MWDPRHPLTPLPDTASPSSQARVNEFMTHDTNSDSEISFAEFMVMTQKSDMASTAKHPGFKLSAGMIETTKQENARLIRQIRN